MSVTLAWIGLVTSVRLTNFVPALIIRLSELRALVGALALVSLFDAAVCHGSPSTLPPAFLVKTSAGIESVSIRELIPGLTDSDFGKLVLSGMERALPPGSVLLGPVEAPYPQCRIVWHVDPSAGRGELRLIANIFDRSIAVAYEQIEVVNDAPTVEVTNAIEMVTERLFHPDAKAQSDPCLPTSG